MVVPEFGNLKGDAGVEKLNAFLAARSYISGYSASQDDCLTAAKLLSAPNASKFPHAYRWYKHVTAFSLQERATWPKGEIKVEAKKEEDDDVDLFGDDDAEELEALKAKKKQEAGAGQKKKKEVINKSSLVIEIKPASSDTDLDEVARLAKAVSIEGVTWGEAVKKVPVAFGLFKLQLSCVILDDIVNTNDITDQLEALGMTEEEKEALRKRQECEDDDAEEEEDDDDECAGLVQSAEIVSFNKL